MTARAMLLVVLTACGRPDMKEPSKPSAPATHPDVTVDATPRPHRRMVSPESFLRSYLQWFGGLAAIEVPKQAGRGLFDQWNDYLGALGLPDYRIDMPRSDQSNPIMLAAIGRLSEALCVRAVEHDLRQRTPLDQRVIFAFDEKFGPSRDEFAAGFDVLHRTFLSYPAAQAPSGRIERFYSLYQQVETEHQGARAPLSAPEAAWAAVCAALVQHPEAGLY